MKFQQIRGATIKVFYGGKTFLIDPFFAPKDFYSPLEACHFPNRRWPTAELPETPEKIVQDIDAVILTHLHPDHFDEFAANMLPKNLPIFVQDEADALPLKNLSFSDIRLLKYEESVFDDVSLYRVNCLHGNPETTQKYYDATGLRETASGVVFKANGEKVFYLAGDTIWFEDVEKAITKYQPNIIALNAADAQFTDSGSIIMGIDDMLKVSQAAPTAKLIITHLDAVPHATIGRKEVRDCIDSHKLQQQILVPEDGELLEF